MKNTVSIFIFILFSLIGHSQQSNTIDSTAIYILDQMADNIGDLQSVTFNLSNSVDEFDDQNRIITQFSKSTINLSGPNKLLIRTEGTKGKIGYWYDGTYVTYYSFDENNYVTLEAPETTIEMIDSMHLNYNFQFPAADFFYPSLTDDIIEQFDTISYIGKRIVHGEECYHIIASNEKLSVQMWISNETFLLPKHFIIIYKDKSNVQYESTFSNWYINPIIPESTFSFIAPPSARLISILKK
ncbi:DUF2092 domain-containing protein [Xanthomarina sp. F2636L]|uniref:DUF2092 domain-containing protein n=1 Tax=Xanthomarina sp. F2636L TaxID=2996018 RepID=UPI00225E14C4|nr:DUF2092 domain-containing protein [Xanthomarina sp. F2636L]MCX7551803.1 DUF2092 domain-containing protein [Xanthomarina sp. F2636L]